MTEAEILQQVRAEYEEGRSFLENRKLRWVAQLVLMNNLNRGDQNIASTMLFSYFYRVHSNLYEDKLQTKFNPNEESEQRSVQSLNNLAQSDFQEMEMSQIEYDWTWDACFFSRGYLETLSFDKKRKIMKPVVINPLMLFYDPYFENLQDWRYYGKWISRSSVQINRLIKKNIVKVIKNAKELDSGFDPEIWNYKVLRDTAKAVTPQGDDSAITPSSNGLYQILEWNTYIDGEKHCVWVDRGVRTLLRKEKIELNDDVDDEISEGKYGSLWPLVIREVFKEPHSSVSISIPDLIEDKHRAKNVLLNLAYIAAKDEVTPIYVYDEENISDVMQLSQRQINQHIPTKSGANPGTVIQPLKKSPALSNSVMQLMNILGNEGSEAIGTTQINPIVQKGKKSATGDALMQQIADLTASVQSKIIGNSEKVFWSHWYQRYVNNMKDGDIKIISMTNSQFVTFEQIQLDNIKTKFPPKITVFSAKEAQFKETVERRELAQQFPMFQQVIPPQQFQQFLKFVYFPKYETFDSQTIDLVFPKSTEELKAESENEMLAKGELPPISETDDHQTHLYIHARVKNNREKWAHYLTHERMLAQQADKAKQVAQGESDDKKAGDEKPSSKDTNKDDASVLQKGLVDKVGKESKISSNIKK